jgi:hypothetical protein
MAAPIETVAAKTTVLIKISKFAGELNSSAIVLKEIL